MSSQASTVFKSPPDLRSWRERALQVTLVVILAISIPSLLFVLMQTSQTYQDWPLAFAIVSVSLLLVPLIVFKNMNHRLRAFSLLAMGYAQAVFGLLRGGLVGDGRLYLIVLPPGAIALMGVRAGVASAVVSSLVYAAFALATFNKWLDSFLVNHESALPMTVWLGDAAGFVMILASVTALTALLVRYLEKSLEKARRDASENRAILDSIADGVITFDLEGTVSTVNATVVRFLDRPSSEIVGHDILSLLSQASPQPYNTIAKLLAISVSNRHKFQWGDKTLSASVAPVQLDSGEEIGRVAVLRDVTHEAELERARESLFAVAAHEFRTPLNVIINYANMLHAGVLSSRERRNATLSIAANSERLLMLANNLLERAQIMAGQVHPNVQPFAPRELLGEVTEAMRVLAEEKGLTLTEQVADDVPVTLIGDPGRLYQILVNLISNAIKFTEEGYVRVAARKRDLDRWELKVTDSGPGISGEAQSRLFKPFELAEDPVTRKHTGAGLGLSITKQLVEVLGGEIELQSQLGQGSTFTVLLPANLPGD
jgi:PAS domain S-box-containing protein